MIRQHHAHLVLQATGSGMLGWITSHARLVYQSYVA
jgi:hypothetical protein